VTIRRLLRTIDRPTSGHHFQNSKLISSAILGHGKKFTNGGRPTHQLFWELKKLLSSQWYGKLDGSKVSMFYSVQCHEKKISERYYPSKDTARQKRDGGISIRYFSHKKQIQDEWRNFTGFLVAMSGVCLNKEETKKSWR
jgi:hypothetical protein